MAASACWAVMPASAMLPIKGSDTMPVELTRTVRLRSVTP